MTEQKQLHGLINILLNKSAALGDRDDAAMDLDAYDDPEIEEALIKVVCDKDEDEDLIDSAAESLANIWRRHNKYKQEIVLMMHPAAQRWFNQ